VPRDGVLRTSARPVPKQSDDLLHNILPDEIATGLKAQPGMIADDFPTASVLFTDVAGFTPMSAKMSPPELLELLNPASRSLHMTSMLSR
jgi:class 3 adenylate cyclase